MKYRLTLHNSHPRPEQPAQVTVLLGEGERCLIGRSPRAQVVCNTGACSREHCVIELVGGELQLCDLGSTGGTWVNGVKVRRAPIARGAVIHPGAVTVTLLEVEPVES